MREGVRSSEAWMCSLFRGINTCPKIVAANQWRFKPLYYVLAIILMSVCIEIQY